MQFERHGKFKKSIKSIWSGCIFNFIQNTFSLSLSSFIPRSVALYLSTRGKEKLFVTLRMLFVPLSHRSAGPIIHTHTHARAHTGTDRPRRSAVVQGI